MTTEKLQVKAVNKEGVRERMSRLESHIGSLKSDMQTIMKQMEALVKNKIRKSLKVIIEVTNKISFPWTEVLPLRRKRTFQC